jgi:hypothetical protein
VSGCGSADRSSWSSAPGAASPASGRSGCVDGHGFGSAPLRLGGQMSRYGDASTAATGSGSPPSAIADPMAAAKYVVPGTVGP